MIYQQTLKIKRTLIEFHKAAQDSCVLQVAMNVYTSVNKILSSR